jgi:hypothetical protein
MRFETPIRSFLTAGQAHRVCILTIKDERAASRAVFTEFPIIQDFQKGSP